jgi:hypothetical protein
MSRDELNMNGWREIADSKVNGYFFRLISGVIK